MDFPAPLLQQCWFLSGPTASGKSATALILAQRLDAEIISLDSMAIYRGLNIGTAKPSAADRQLIPHHLIDVADPCQDFSVADFVLKARVAASDIVARGRTPLFTGGTGLYLRAILRGIATGPDADWTLRNELQQKAVQFGPQWLHEQLANRDPATAARLHLNDMRRIIRAIEVHELTGRPISESQQHQPRPPHERPRSVVWLEPPRDWLRERISIRVDQMIDAGWIEEARWVMNLNPPASKTALQALGYRELIQHLRGESTLDSAVQRIKTLTQQFAKRQHTWFRNLEECRSITILGTESPEELADQILRLSPGTETS